MISVNVGGLVGPSRRRVFYHWLRTVVNAEIILLQETHCNTHTRALKWSEEWGGVDRAHRANTLDRLAWFSLSSSSSKGGSAILITKKFANTHTLTQVTTTDTHNGAWVHLHVIHKATNIPLTYSSTYPPLSQISGC